LLRLGVKASKKDTMSLLEISSEEEDYSDRSDFTTNIESPVVKFPEKIHMNTIIFEGMVPKLDMTKVREKYKDANNNKVMIANTINKSNRSNLEYIEKLKFQLKMCKNTIKAFKQKFEKMNKLITIQKGELAKTKSKIELLELKYKRSEASTYDNSHKMNNTSMVRYHLYSE
jgi:galactokinase